MAEPGYSRVSLRALDTGPADIKAIRNLTGSGAKRILKRSAIGKMDPGFASDRALKNEVGA